MNIDYKFKLIKNEIKEQEHLRAYEVKFLFPAFRTKESDNANEINAARLSIIYARRKCCLSFFH